MTRRILPDAALARMLDFEGDAICNALKDADWNDPAERGEMIESMASFMTDSCAFLVARDRGEAVKLENVRERACEYGDDLLHRLVIGQGDALDARDLCAVANLLAR